MKKIILLIMLLSVISINVNAQVGIYPQLIFIDGASRSSYVKMYNQSDETKEAFLNYKFEVTRVDTNFSEEKRKADSILEQKYSLDKYLKIFPKRLSLKTQADMMIRFLVMHPPDLPDGTYITKLHVKSKSLDKQIDTVKKTFSKDIHAAMSLGSEIVTLVVYQKGELTTDAEVLGMTTSEDSFHLNLDFDFKHSGNSPFWGNIVCNLKDEAGNVVDKSINPFSVYCDSKQSVQVKKKFLSRGKKYKAEIIINTDREDLPVDKIIKKEPVTKNFDFIFPDSQNKLVGR